MSLKFLLVARTGSPSPPRTDQGALQIPSLEIAPAFDTDKMDCGAKKPEHIRNWADSLRTPCQPRCQLNTTPHFPDRDRFRKSLGVIWTLQVT